MIKAGAFRHSLRVEQQVTTLDGVGQRVSTWTTFVTRRCAIVRLPGAEVVASAARNERVPTIFQIRFTEGITAAMRVIHNERRYNIGSVIDANGMRESQQLVCTEEGAA